MEVNQKSCDLLEKSYLCGINNNVTHGNVAFILL